MPEETKFKIDSVFGTVLKGYFEWDEDDLPEFQEEYDEERKKSTLVVYVSDTKTWTEKKHCSDHYEDDTRDALRSIGLQEQMEGVFEQGKKNTMTREELIYALAKLGFIYNKDFEEYMKRALE